MTLNADCGNAEALIGYLYDECDAAERSAMAAHLAVCARCATELGALRQTRTEMAAWTPPATQLGFRIVADVVRPEPVRALVAEAVPVRNNVIRPARWWAQPLPAWAQAAAAAVIFAVGLGLGALRGTAPSAPASASTQDLAAVEQRLRTEMKAEMQAGMQQLRPVAATAVASPLAVPPAVSRQIQDGSGLTLQQVRSLIDESERRQQRELALRTAEVIRDFDTQRRGDLTRIEAAFGQIEGRTGAQVQQQQRILDNLLMRVSQQP